jgi:hypothetical protein
MGWANNKNLLLALPPMRAPVKKKLLFFTQIHSWMNLRIATVVSVCLSVCVSVCNVRESRPEFWTQFLRVGRIICSIHPVIRKTKPDKKIPPVSFPFPVPNVEGVAKNLKISCSMIVRSAVWKAIAVRFSLLDRACRAAHCANISFSIPDYSPVLHRLKCPAQRWTRIQGAVLVAPPGEHGSFNRLTANGQLGHVHISRTRA